MSEGMAELRDRISTLEKERDEALKQAQYGWERHAEKDRAYGEALAQRDAAREELARVQSMPELEWAQVSSAITQALATIAAKQPVLARSLLKALDKGKVYVGRLRAERHAALADNAALMEMVLSGEPGHDYQGLCPDRWQPKARDPECAACRLMSAPHPGAALLEEVAALRASKALLQKGAAICRGLQHPDEEALSVLEPLLEEHRKAMENEQQRYRNVIARLSEEVAHFTGTLCAAAFTDVLNGISRVAVHARNKGLEEAREAVRAALTTGLLTPGNVLHVMREIDAMKEPES